MCLGISKTPILNPFKQIVNLTVDSMVITPNKVKKQGKNREKNELETILN
jgi:hypothetical protein